MYTPQRYLQAIQWWYLQQYGVLSNTEGAPTATTQSATSVTSTSATLNGTVSANGASTVVEFEYGTTSGSYTSTITATQSPVTGDSIAVSASITLPGVTTYYRVKATNSNGTTYGTEQKVSTLIANLVAYWKLDEASGTRIDSHGSADMTDNRGVGSVTGVQGNAASFDGTTKLSSTNASLRPGTSDFALSFWMNVDASDVGAFYVIIGAYDGSSQGYYVQFNPTTSGRIQAWFNSSGPSAGAVTAVSSLSYADSTWHHIAVNFDRDGNMSVYADGNSTPIATVSISGGAADDLSITNPFLIGGYDTTADTAFDVIGDIDEASLWIDRLLTTDEIAALYNSGSGITYPFN